MEVSKPNNMHTMGQVMSVDLPKYYGFSEVRLEQIQNEVNIFHESDIFSIQKSRIYLSRTHVTAHS